MLEHLPNWLGRILEPVRAGADKLAIAQPGLAGADHGEIAFRSPAFADHARLPERFTADGVGISPPLAWGTLPTGTASLALLVEDADAPTPQPLVHAIVWGLQPGTDGLAEGAIVADGDGTAGDVTADVGRNSFLREGWLPPDPPTGHGVHRYVFQLFALGPDAGDPGHSPGRGAMIEAMTGHVLAMGVFTGTYSREEVAPVGPAGEPLAV